MKLKSINGKVPYIMAAGKDFVRGEMPLEAAKRLYASGAKTTSDLFPDYPICVDEKFYFAAISTKRKSNSNKDSAPCED